MASYTGVAKFLHWLIALLVISLAGLGLTMTRGGFGLEAKLKLYQVHKSLGLTVLALMVVRILWRLRHAPPALPDTITPFERLAARWTHVLLYALLLVIPVSGWLLVSGSVIAVPTRYFWLFAVPHFEPLASLSLEARRGWAPLLKEVHFVMALILLALVGLHAAAALRHHFALKDDVLTRMLPARRRRHDVVAALIAAGLIMLLAPDATAQEAPAWKVDAAKSSLAFEVDAGGQRFPGAFAAFTIDVRFDPAAPEKTRIKAVIKTASLKTGTDEIDSAIAGKDWLDAKQFPDAVFVADSAERTGEGSYRLKGTLTIKGRSKPVDVAFKLGLTGARGRIDGEATVNRLDFAIGPEGAIEGTVIAREVKLKLVIEADRGG